MTSESSPSSLWRHRAIVAATTGVVALALIGIAAWQGNTSGDDAEPEADHTPPTYQEEEDEDAGEGEIAPDGDVEVAEFGHTVISFDDDELVTWAAIVENTSARYDASVSLVLTPETAGGKTGERWISRVDIPPGEHGAGDDFIEQDISITDVSVSIEDVEWSTAHRSLMEVGEIEVEQLDTVLRVQFHVDSEYSWVREPDAHAVFRDTGGDIVAGSPPENLDDAEVPPGWSVQQFDIMLTMPRGIDHDATEVYIL